MSDAPFTLTRELDRRRRRSRFWKCTGILFLLIGLTLFTLFCLGPLRVGRTGWVALSSFFGGAVLAAVGGMILYDSRENLRLFLADACWKQLRKAYPDFTASRAPVDVKSLQSCALFHPRLNNNLEEDDDYAWRFDGTISGKKFTLSQVRGGEFFLSNGGWTGTVFFEGLFLKLELETKIASPVLALTSPWGEQFDPPKLLLWPGPPYPPQTASTASGTPAGSRFKLYATQLPAGEQMNFLENVLRGIGTLSDREIAIGIYPDTLYAAVAWRWTKLPSRDIAAPTAEQYTQLVENLLEYAHDFIRNYKINEVAEQFTGE